MFFILLFIILLAPESAVLNEIKLLLPALAQEAVCATVHIALHS